MVQAADSRLDNQPDFEEKLRSRDPNKEVSTGDRDETFRAAVEVMNASFVQGKDLSGSSPACGFKMLKQVELKI